MQLGKQDGGNKAVLRRSRGESREFDLFRILKVARIRFSRIACVYRQKVPQLSRDICGLTTGKNLSL